MRAVLLLCGALMAINISPDILSKYGVLDPEHSDMGLQLSNAFQGEIPGSPGSYFFSPGGTSKTWEAAQKDPETQYFNWERPQDKSGLASTFLSGPAFQTFLYALGGNAAGAGSAVAGAGAAASPDAIELGYQLMQQTGAPTINAAANAAGYGSFEAYLGAVNPSLLSAAGIATAGLGGPAGADGAAGTPGAPGTPGTPGYTGPFFDPVTGAEIAAAGGAGAAAPVYTGPFFDPTGAEISATGAPIQTAGGTVQSGATTAAPKVPTPSPVGGGGPGSSGSFSDFLKENKGLILPGAGLALSLASYERGGKKAEPQTANLTGVADALKTSPSGQAADTLATNLIPSVETGKLPPGAEMNVSRALSDAQASIKSKYASMGMSGSTVEAQELSQAAARAEEMRFSLANQLTQTGLAAAGVKSSDLASSAAIYEAIMNQQLQSDSALTNALARFAGSAALGAGAAAK